jgi:hypothetical protein
LVVAGIQLDLIALPWVTAPTPVARSCVVDEMWLVGG